MSSRKSRQVETRMVSEYMLSEYGQYTHLTKVPLGKVPQELMSEVGYKRAVGITRPFRPEVDAVAVLPGALVLIEAKVWNVVNGLAKLPMYKALVSVTPELAQYSHLPVIMELVVGWTNDNLEIMARDHGIRVKVYCPEWLEEVVEDMHKYWTPEYRAQREEKMKLREAYGLD